MCYKAFVIALRVAFLAFIIASLKDLLFLMLWKEKSM